MCLMIIIPIDDRRLCVCACAMYARTKLLHLILRMLLAVDVVIAGLGRNQRPAVWAIVAAAAHSRAGTGTGARLADATVVRLRSQHNGRRAASDDQKKKPTQTQFRSHLALTIRHHSHYGYRLSVQIGVQSLGGKAAGSVSVQSMRAGIVVVPSLRCARIKTIWLLVRSPLASRDRCKFQADGRTLFLPRTPSLLLWLSLRIDRVCVRSSFARFVS